MIFRALFFILGLYFTSSCASLVQIDPGLPEAVSTTREMVVTANPLATEAGAQILKMGGTAVDAMVAVQLVLGLVEPQSSGIGGGAFVVYYDASTRRRITVDAREKAPASATAHRFLVKGSPVEFVNAWQSGLSVGVPGVPRLMDFMHKRYGRLPWQQLFSPAVTLAQQGFELTARTSEQVAKLLKRNSSCSDGARLFFRDPVAFEFFADSEHCTAKPAGTWMVNKAYADTLNTLAEKGADAFYSGPIANDIVAAVQSDVNISGDMTVEDLSNYHVVERDPVCLNYQGYDVCGMGPPSSGGLAVGQILGIIEKRPDLLGERPLDVASVHLFTQAGRLAFADRNRYVADSDFVSVPVSGMLDENYLAERAALITSIDMGTAEPGLPPGCDDARASDRVAKSGGTSHVSIIDRYGNALSMTTSVESSFGNGVMVNGFLLNNQLTDFSFDFEDEKGDLIANRVEPNKRPRSSMSPTIIFDRYGRVALITGSPGGSRIIGYTAQSIMNVISFALNPQQAIAVPHYMNRNGRTELEAPLPGVTLDYDAEALATALIARGHSNPLIPSEQRSVDIIEQTSGLSIIQVDNSASGQAVLFGGADKRRDGTVGGQ